MAAKNYKSLPPSALRYFIQKMQAAFAKEIIHLSYICFSLLFRHAIVNLSLQQRAFIMYSDCR